MYHNHTICRACGYASPLASGVKVSGLKERLVPVFDLGIQPLANDFASNDEERAGYAPLKVMLCPRCTLAQLSVVVKPEILYSKYLYVTSQSETMRKHFESLGKTIRAEQPFDSLLEIGSNDGTMLKYFASQGVKVVGIDPAENLADVSRKLAIPTVTGTFNSNTAKSSLCGMSGGFDVIMARHVFCHVDDWRDFINCLAIPSHKNTLVCIEVPYLRELLDRGEFDTIYHEHLSYLSIKAFQFLLKDSPFWLQNVVSFPIHGGAILLMLRTKEFQGQPYPKSDDFTEEHWRVFADKAHANIAGLKSFVAAARADNKRVVGFGASAKSTVWLNACGFTRKDIEFITDTTPQKWFKLSPGTDIPIVDEGAILRELPDYAVCFAWNFRDFVLKNNSLAREKGVKFVFPIPSLEIV